MKNLSQFLRRCCRIFYHIILKSVFTLEYFCILHQTTSVELVCYYTNRKKIRNHLNYSNDWRLLHLVLRISNLSKPSGWWFQNLIGGIYLGESPFLPSRNLGTHDHITIWLHGSYELSNYHHFHLKLE